MQIKSIVLLAVSAGLMAATPVKAGGPLRGDINLDGLVNSHDLSLLLGYWGSDYERADINGTGRVNAEDLGLLLGLITGDAPQREPIKMGINPSGVAYYTREWTFVNVFNAAREWHSDQPITLGPDGWPRLEPGQSVSTLMLRTMDGHYAAGEYNVLWEGTGEVSIAGFDVVNTSWNAPISDTSGHFTFRINEPSNGGIALRIDESDPNDPVRDIRVILPGFDPHDHPVFHPLFKQRLEPFDIIRFMPWCGLGQTSTVRWDDRTTLDSPRQSSDAGVAVEHMVDLCNELDMDPWFCMPHLATDNYMRRFAHIVRDRLEPGRVAYIEFSNEVWNAIFDQAIWNFQEAARLGISFQEHYAIQCLRLFEIWEDVFQGQMHRVRRVVGTQLTNYGVTNGILRHIPQGAADVLSPAAYFKVTPHLDPEDITENTPLSAIFEAARLGIEDCAVDMEYQQAQAEAHGLELIAYEGGQHLANVFGGDHPSIQRFADANQHPEMRELYLEHFQRQSALGIEGICHLGYVNDQNDQHGAWGALGYQDQPRSEAPKYDALLQFIEAQRAMMRMNDN